MVAAGEFTVTCYSDKPVALEEFDKSDLWNRSTVQGAWDAQTAGGSISCQSWRENTQYIVEMHGKCNPNRNSLI